MYSALLLLNLLPLAIATPAAKRSELAPLLIPRDGNIIADKYIVKYKENFPSSSDHVLKAHSAEAERVYSHIFKGFAGPLDRTALDQLRNHPGVEYVENDAKVTINGFVEQTGAPWGLAHISHRKTSGDTYAYDDSAGEGTCAYVIDTGIDDTHPEFEGRASQIRSFVDGPNTDGHGHGTHVAGTIGSRKYGVAKKTKIYGIKVLDNSGTGTWAGVLSGMDFAIADSKQRSCPKGVVANMSLGGSASASVNEGAAKMIQSGIFLAVAAGNEGDDASTVSPASEPTVCTVGATESGSNFAWYSNYGSLVDILAPGSNVLSTWPGSTTNTISGTSMATPHIVGLGAYLAALEGFPGPQALCERIRSLATKDAITGVPGGTANLFAFNGNPSG